MLTLEKNSWKESMHPMRSCGLPSQFRYLLLPNLLSVHGNDHFLFLVIFCSKLIVWNGIGTGSKDKHCTHSSYFHLEELLFIQKVTKLNAGIKSGYSPKDNPWIIVNSWKFLRIISMFWNNIRFSWKNWEISSDNFQFPFFFQYFSEISHFFKLP